MLASCVFLVAAFSIANIHGKFVASNEMQFVYCNSVNILSTGVEAGGGFEIRAVATFNSQGVSGYIRFTEREVVTIIVNLDGLTGDAYWSIHKFPVLTTIDPNLRWMSDFVGPIYDPIQEREDACGMDTPSGCAVGDLTNRFGVNLSSCMLMYVAPCTIISYIVQIYTYSFLKGLATFIREMLSSLP